MHATAEHDATPSTDAARSTIAADALRYWEPRRIAYNLALATVTGTVFALNRAGFERAASADLFLGLFVLAVLANVAYCAAYPVDVFVQRSGLAAARRRVRVAVPVVGTAFACVIAQFIARGIVGAP